MIRTIDRNLSDGARVVIAFTALWYVLPAIAAIAVDPPAVFLWPRARADVWAHFGIAVLCLVVPAVSAGWGRPAARSSASEESLPVGAFALSALAIGLGAFAFLGGASSWRYGGASMSERVTEPTGAITLAIAVMQAIAPCIAWWIMLMHPEAWTSGSWSARIIRWAAAAAAISGINGLNTAIRALFATSAMAWPREVRRVLFDGARADAAGPGAVAALAGLAVLAVAFANTGMLAKTRGTTEADWESHTDPSYLLRRHSVHFQHAMGALEIGIDEQADPRGFRDRLALSWREATYRLGVLTGDPSWGARPEPSSLSRWTLERFADFDLRNDTRSGSSPSVIGTAALCVPPPWSFVAIAAFSFLLVRLLDWFLEGCDRLSAIGCLLLAYMPLRFVTDTPLGLLNPFGIPAVVVGVAVIARLGHGMYIRARPWAPATGQDSSTAPQ